MQTFVLTPQSPNKYYVRNDIFRYQDEIFPDDNENSLEKNEIESKNESNVEPESLQPSEIIEKDYSYQSNGTISNAGEEQVSSVEEAVVNQDELETIQEASLEVNTSLISVADSKEEIEEEIESVSDVTSNSNQLYNEPKTYASMLSKNFLRGSNPNLNLKQTSVLINVANTAISDNTDIGNSVENPLVQSNKNIGFQPQRDRFPKRGGFGRRNESRESTKNDSDSGDGENQSNSGSKLKYSDDHQLFIGNLLPNFSEDELVNIFKQFGEILDVRINRQINYKSNSNKANRNYGFITFKDPSVVDQIIAQKVILFYF